MCSSLHSRICDCIYTCRWKQTSYHASPRFISLHFLLHSRPQSGHVSAFRKSPKTARALPPPLPRRPHPLPRDPGDPLHPRDEIQHVRQTDYAGQSAADVLARQVGRGDCGARGGVGGSVGGGHGECARRGGCRGWLVEGEVFEGGGRGGRRGCRCWLCRRARAHGRWVRAGRRARVVRVARGWRCRATRRDWGLNPGQ